MSRCVLKHNHASIDHTCAGAAIGTPHSPHTRPHSLFVNVDDAQINCSACKRALFESGVPADPSPAPKHITAQQLSHCICPEHAGPVSPTASSASVATTASRRPPRSYIEYLSSRRGGAMGFNNLGNTCYFNAALQAMLHWWGTAPPPPPLTERGCSPPFVGFMLELDELPEFTRQDMVRAGSGAHRVARPARP